MLNKLGVVLFSLFLIICGVAAGCAPIHDAAAKDDVLKVEALLKKSPGLINAVDKDGATPLHYAAAKGCDAAASVLIKSKANINARKKDGVTPLHVAAGLGKDGVVDLLLNNKADINAVDNKGRTPLSLAKDRGYASTAALLEARIKSIAEEPRTTVPQQPATPPNTPNNTPRIINKTPAPAAAGIKPDNVKRATDFMELLSKQNYTAAENMFNSTLKNALPASKIQSFWQETLQSTGNFVRVSNTRNAVIDGKRAVYATCEFAKTKADMQFAFDNDGKISGIYLVPAKKQE